RYNQRLPSLQHWMFTQESVDAAPGRVGRIFNPHPADAAIMGAVKCVGEAENGGEPNDCPLLVGQQITQGLMVALGQSSTMKTRDPGRAFNVFRPPSQRCPMFLDQFLGLFVMSLVAFDLSNIVEQRGRIQAGPVVVSTAICPSTPNRSSAQPAS